MNNINEKTNIMSADDVDGFSILKNDQNYKKLIVKKIIPKYDLLTNCNGYAVYSRKNYCECISNVNNKEDIINAGDTIFIYYDYGSMPYGSRFVRGVVNENGKVLFYYPPTLYWTTILSDIQNRRLLFLKQNEEKYLRYLDDEFNKLSYVSQIRIKFWRTMIPDFRLLCEEREINLLKTLEHCKKTLYSIYDNFTDYDIKCLTYKHVVNDIVNNCDQDILEDKHKDEIDFIAKLLLFELHKNNGCYFAEVSYHVRNLLKLYDKEIWVWCDLQKWTLSEKLEKTLSNELSYWVPNIFSK